jgi:hypothetical protein
MSDISAKAKQAIATEFKQVPDRIIISFNIKIKT